MNFYYEIKLNFNDEELYEFFEWSHSDMLEHIKKIPLVRVRTKVFQDIISHQFKISLEFLNQIKGRVSTKNGKINCACLFCDTKNCVAIEFDDEGNSIARSSLLLEDENNICEIAYSLKCREIEINKKEKIRLSSECRQEKQIKKIITKEIIELYKKENIPKLKYLYYEWFNKKEDNKEVIIKEMFKDINKNLNKVHYEIYKIIKLSYSNI